MSYQTKVEVLTLGGVDYRIRSLLDRQQYDDPTGEAERAGISSASWPLFGMVWPSSRVLAREMSTFDLDRRNILEVGAGLGLASLVVRRRSGQITMSDCHPLCPSFLHENELLNELEPIAYQTGNWNTENPDLGRFDLVIGSDLLYERDQPMRLARFINAHLTTQAEVLIVDPDRGHRSHFRRAMCDLGFAYDEYRAAPTLESGEPYKGRFLHFVRY